MEKGWPNQLDELRKAAIEDVARALLSSDDELYATAEAMVDSLTAHIMAQPRRMMRFTKPVHPDDA